MHTNGNSMDLQVHLPTIQSKRLANVTNVIDFRRRSVGQLEHGIISSQNRLSVSEGSGPK